jgi:hypothetical protein
MSLGWPPRATGWAAWLIIAMAPFACASSSAGTSSEVVKMLVLMKPGCTAFTRIWWRARSAALVLVRWSTPALATAVGIGRVARADGGDGGSVDDGGALAADHVRHGIADAEGDRAQQEVHGAVPALGLDLVDLGHVAARTRAC